MIDKFDLIVLKEANDYIHNIVGKFGSFNYAPKNTRPTPGKFEHHLDEMIPGFRNPVDDLNDKSTDTIEDDAIGTSWVRAGSNSSSSSISSSSFSEKTVNSTITQQVTKEFPESPVEDPISLMNSPDFKDLVKGTWESMCTLQEENETLKTMLKKERCKNEKLCEHYAGKLGLAQFENQKLMTQIKMQQWCHICLCEMKMEHPPTCLNCSLK